MFTRENIFRYFVHENKETKMVGLLTLPKDALLPVPESPDSWSVSREIVVAQASRRREITFQQTDHLLSDRNSDHSEFEVNQAIQRPRGERARCDPTDIAEHQKGGPRSLVQMEFDNRSHRSSTCLSLSKAFQPLPP